MAIFTDLPIEILLQIFETLRSQSSSSTLTSAMLCCRTWHSVISSLLYTHVSLDSKLNLNSPSTRFATQLSYSPLVHSFRLNICQVHLMGFNIGFAKAIERLNETCKVLSGLESLRTFSLSLEEHTGQQYLLPASALVRVLRSLPPSVINLDLDVGSLDKNSTPHWHVCTTLSTLLPRLHRLRLRLSHLCSSVFETLHHAPQAFSKTDNFWIAKSTSELRYAVIRLDTRPDSIYGTNSRICKTRHEVLRARDLATALESMYQNGAFPFLRRFAIIDRVDAEPLAHNEHWNVFKVRSITEKKTFTFPWCARGGCSSLFMIRDMGGRDYFGSFTEISNSVEGLLAWKRFGYGASVPQRRMVRRKAWDLDLGRLVEREEVVKCYGVSFRLWEHEELTGMRLLDVRSEEGFEDEEAIGEVLPGDWGWVPEGRWQWTIQRMV